MRTNKSKRRRWLRRLFAMQPYEIAWVTFGANHRAFAIVKEDSGMKVKGKSEKTVSLKDLEKAQGVLGELIPIFKADAAMTPEAGKQVAEKLDLIADLILPEEETPAPVDTLKALKKLATDLVQKLEGLANSAIAVDYTFGDQVDGALEVAKQLDAAFDTAPTMDMPPPAAVADPAPAVAAADPAPASEPAAVDPAPQTAAPADDPAPIDPPADDPPATQDAAATDDEPTDPGPAAGDPPKDEPEQVAAPDEPAATAAPAAAAAASGDAAAAADPAPPAGDPPAGDPPAPEPVTADTVKSLIAEAFSSFKDEMKALVANVQKAAAPGAMPPPPVTQSITVRPPQAAPPSDPLEFMDLTRSADLAKIDEYGNIKD